MRLQLSLDLLGKVGIVKESNGNCDVKVTSSSVKGVMRWQDSSVTPMKKKSLIVFKVSGPYQDKTAAALKKALDSKKLRKILKCPVLVTGSDVEVTVF